MAATLSFCEALNGGIASGTLVDTKIILFSRRNSSGRVHGPKALYASSHVLKSVPYFDQLLFGTFSEAGSQDFGDSFDEDESPNDYGYHSDSDLEGDDDGAAVDVLKGALRKATPPKDAVKDALRKVTPEKGTLRRALTTDSLRRLGGGSFRMPPQEKYSERAHRGKVVRIPDMAFITFQAFLLYLYTGEIEFAPIKRGENRKRRSVGLFNLSHDDVPQPSPKSIYRLADKYDIPTLKRLALCRVRIELKNCDIVQETFSKFASKHDEIRTECVTQLVSVLINDTSARSTWARVSAVIDRHSRGDLEHVTEALSLLWSTVNQRGAATSLSQPSWQAPTTKKPTNWKALKAAMIKSIKHGVFFDQKYWARHSRDGRVLKPIYFSSLILGDVLRPCIVHSNGQDVVTKGPTGKIDPESDCESDSTGAEEDTSALWQGRKGEKYGQVRATLSPGSFAAWRSLFIYLCTDEILFAPLASQGADFRLAYILQNGSSTPPCSPKTIYVLANSLNLQPLKDLALRDIESKLSEDNIVEEFLSHVSFTQREILNMACRLFFSRFSTQATISRMQERIASICASRSAHQADAFKIGLQATIDLKKRDSLVGTGCVMLQCRERDCPGNTGYTSYSLDGVENNEFCQPCYRIGRTCFLVCTGCGHERMGRDSWCQHCDKRFGLVVSSPR